MYTRSGHRSAMAYWVDNKNERYTERSPVSQHVQILSYHVSKLTQLLLNNHEYVQRTPVTQDP